MIDCVDAIVVPEAASPYVRPSAAIVTVEGGKVVLHVVRGRDEALRILADKRAQTRAERYETCLKYVERSMLPERADAPSTTVVSDAARQLVHVMFEALPRYELLERLVYEETPRLDAFRLPPSYDVESGFAVVRTLSGPLLETFHTRRQAADFLERHAAHIGEEEMEEAEDAFGRSPIASHSPLAPEAFGGFMAALVGARFRLARIINRKMRGLDP
jgi:hypothetical protein